MAPWALITGGREVLEERLLPEKENFLFLYEFTYGESILKWPDGLVCLPPFDISEYST